MCQKFIFFFYFLLISVQGFCDRGIITAASGAYVTNLCRSISYLRNELKCTLPIEIWHANELNFSTQKQLSKIPGVVVRNLMDSVHDRAAWFFHGWQIKAFILEATQFDEVILMDADVFFFKNPEILFDQEGYQESGAYFFRDRNCFAIPYEVSPIKNLYIKRRGSLQFYEMQRRFICSLIDSPSSCVPDDWLHYWNKVPPSKECPIFTEKLEAGCVVIDKKQHRRGIQEIVKLNADKERVYKLVYGDKETYWLGFEIAKEPYALNKEYAASAISDGKIVSHVLQMLDGEVFYVQKLASNLNANAYREFFNGRKEPFTPKEVSFWNALFQRVWEY